MINRQTEIKALTALLKRHRVVAIIGARQVGKTTLAREIAKKWRGAVSYFDIEDPSDEARLADPMLTLRPLQGLVVIDEIQRVPDLFPVLRVLADAPRPKTRYLLLGSASPDLLRCSSETLAGRIHYHEIDGLSVDEVGIENHERLWVRGGFPRSFLARSEAASHEWREGFVRTFLTRDLPQLGIGVKTAAMRRFWTMLAHYHGQIWNASEFARSFGVADTTVRNYLDSLSDALVVDQLQPWHVNISKRQVKAPKIYISDTGLLHALLNLRNKEDVLSHPKCGASWEGFAMKQVIRQLGASRQEYYFWATHAGAELDLLVARGNKRLGFEFKRTSKPSITTSMRIALEDLHLSSLDVLYPGDDVFPLAPKIRAVGMTKLATAIKPLK